MAFKVKKDDKKAQIKLVSFRLAESLIVRINKIAEKEKLTVTALVKQMLEYCVEDYDKKK